MMVKKYSEYVRQLASKIPKSIVDLSQPRRRSKAPTQAFSEFAIHREQGDWAERLLTQALSSMLEDFVVVKYGRSDEIMAGEEGFEKFYEEYQDELDSIGKRPDILIFAKEDWPDESLKDISGLEMEKLATIVPRALAGFEIRSSSFLSRKYMKAIQNESKSEKRKSRRRAFLSFTPKVEDLVVVLKWIETYNVPHYYVQVFFDAAYVMPFHRILQIISDPANRNKIFTIETNVKNQQKRTIHIDIGQGQHLGDINFLPEHYSALKELARGRLLYFVKFKGAKLDLKRETVSQIIEEAKNLKGFQRSMKSIGP